MYRFQVVGHRGAPCEAPENTLLSFERAIEMGVDWIEFDLRETRDHVLVVIHDATVDRTTYGHGKVANMTFDEIERLNTIASRKIPSLMHTIELAKDRVRMDMEIKEPGIEEDVVEAIQFNAIGKQCMVSSFLYDSIKKVKELDPKIMTAAILGKMPDDPAAYLHRLVKDAGADAIMLGTRIATPPFIGQVRRQGLKVGIWNADEPEDIEKYAAMDPDFLCSNYPDRLIELKEAGRQGIIF